MAMNVPVRPTPALQKHFGVIYEGRWGKVQNITLFQYWWQFELEVIKIMTFNIMIIVSLLIKEIHY